MNINVKKFLDDPKKAVRTFPNLKLSPSPHAQVITSTDQADPDKHVALISGGGSGHEPAHALFVGKGVLSAAVCGHVFTSPDVESILRAIKMVTGKAGALLIIKNYMGDRLNFKLAAQMAGALGYKVKCVVVDDDAAFSGCENVDVRKKRGLAGTLFVHKVAGAAAAKGLSLDEVEKIAQVVISQVSTMGVSFGPCAIPGQDKPMFEIPDDEIEMGLGIHGEMGVERIKMTKSSVIVSKLLNNITREKKVEKGSRCALMVNNLGGVSQLEMFVVASQAIEGLTKEHGCQIERVFVGTLMTSLGMKGASVTLLQLPRGREKEFLAYLDLETSCPVWPKTLCENIIVKDRLAPEFSFREEDSSSAGEEHSKKIIKEKMSARGKVLKLVMTTVAERMVESEEELNGLDAKIGDGDTGSAIKRGGELLVKRLDSVDFSSSVTALYEVGKIVQTMGGTSGAVYCSLMVSMARKLKEGGSWGEAVLAGCDGVSVLGGAKEGDCTYLDALYPVARLLVSNPKATVNEMYLAAKKGADSTIDKEKKVGRSSGLQKRSIGHIDPGAQNIVNLIKSLEKIEKDLNV